MSEPAQKWENYAIFKQKYTTALLTAFKMAYSCCFSHGWNIEFPPKTVLKHQLLDAKRNSCKRLRDHSAKCCVKVVAKSQKSCS